MPFYISTIIGDGSETNPYRPQAADVAKNWHAALPTDANWRPVRSWSLVNAESVPALEIHPDIDALPKVARNAIVSVADKNKIKQILTKRGIGSSHVNAAVNFDEILKGIK